MKIEKGQRFPDMQASVLEGDDLALPDDLEGLWAVVIFYRGHW